MDPIEDEMEYVSYLLDHWLVPSRISVDDTVYDSVVSCVMEIYLNVFHHTESPIGVVTCGQYFPNKKELDITLVDFGVGIPSNVRRFLKKSRLSAGNSIKWTFQEGNTTLKEPNTIPRGRGLKELKRFIQANKGKIEVYSETGRMVVDSNGEHAYNDMIHSFSGTVVQITLNCDEMKSAHEKFIGTIPTNNSLF